MPRPRMYSSVVGVDAALAGAGGAGSLSRAGFLAKTFYGGLRHWIGQEGANPNLFCWFVVCFAIGDILFFQSDGDARLIWPVAAGGSCLVLARLCRRHDNARRAALALLAVFAGFASGVLRLHRAETPVLQKTMIATVTGFIEAVEPRAAKSPQLTIRVDAIDGVGPADLPTRIRVTLRKGAVPVAGQYVSAKVRLLPLPQPVRPGGYDFARDSYFKGLGGLGSVLGAISVMEPKSAPAFGLSVSAAIDRARNQLTERIYRTVGGQAGGVAAALVTGKRGYISERTSDVFRAAGIFHIVAISGLHMAIAAGLFFWSARAFLACFPALVLRWPVKKIAAVIAMFGAIAYCLFSGASVSTQRALVMALIMFGAVLAERRALSMRNLAIAALIVLLIAPESLMGPSFQMSFAAVASLIPLAAVSRRLVVPMARGSMILRFAAGIANWFFGLAAATLTAGLATAPFAAYHFQTAVPYGLIGNALALPLVSFIVMPMGALGALAYPFSLDQPMWQIMGLATGMVIDVSTWVASLDGALQHFPAFGAGAALFAALALVMIGTLVSPLRLAALVPLAAALILASMPVRYLVFVDRDGKAAAVRGRDGNLFMVGAANAFLAEQWLRADGDDRSGGDKTLRQDMHCDMAGCIGEGVVTVAVVKNRSALREDCRRAEVVVAPYEIPPNCAAPVVIGRRELGENGAASVTIDRNGRLQVRYARQQSETWPWQLRRGARQQVSAASSE